MCERGSVVSRLVFPPRSSDARQMPVVDGKKARLVRKHFEMIPSDSHYDPPQPEEDVCAMLPDRGSLCATPTKMWYFDTGVDQCMVSASHIRHSNGNEMMSAHLFPVL